jgi:predicted thioesterase
MLNSGDSAQAEIIVQPNDSASRLALEPSDDFPEVFATSRMIALMELAAARAMRATLEQGQLSVGVVVNVRHTAATPLGCRVRAEATFQGMEGKLYRFKVVAFDEAGVIGEGEHTRAVVLTERLLQGAERRRRVDEPTR